MSALSRIQAPQDAPAERAGKTQEKPMPKLTLQLSPEMERVLDQLADSRQLPKSQVLRRAMLLMQYLDDQVADNHDIVIRDKTTGETSRLVFESQMAQPPSERSRTQGAEEHHPVPAGASNSGTPVPQHGT
jgi:predicted transcriptional regulator